MSEPQEIQTHNQVAVVDVKMPFPSMVIFLVKLAIASIPAIIILTLIFGSIGLIFGEIFMGMHY